MGNDNFRRLRCAVAEYSDYQLHPIAKAAIEKLVEEQGSIPRRSQINGLFRRSLCARDSSFIFNHTQVGKSDQSFEVFVMGKIGREMRRLSQASNAPKANEAKRNHAYFSWVWHSLFENELTAPKRVAQKLFKRLDLPSSDKELRAKAQVMLFEAWMSHVFAHSIEQVAKPPYQHKTKGGK